MSLLKFFLKAADVRDAAGTPHPEGWKDDPLAHPDLERMSPTELADLPLWAFSPELAEPKRPLTKCG